MSDFRAGGGTWEFGEFELDLDAFQLRRGGEVIRLAPQQLQLLVLLCESRGRLVSRQQIRERLWGERVVEFDQSLAHCLGKLRSALGDDAKTPSYVETVPRLGLRFLPEVRRLSSGPAAGETERSSAKSPRRPVGLIFAAALLSLALLAVLWLFTHRGDGATAPDADPGHLTVRMDVPSNGTDRELLEDLADRLPALIGSQMRRSASIRLAIERSAGAISLRTVLRSDGRPTVTMVTEVPEGLSVELLARDLAGELRVQLDADPSSGAEREETVTIRH